MKKLICEYCGKEKAEIMFCIGASNVPDWCMHEGTGKVSCPDCFEKGAIESQKIIKQALI